MSGRIVRRLRELGITLPRPSVPPAIYSPFHVWDGIVTVAGQPPYHNGDIRYFGRVGDDVDLETARTSAQLSALNVLAHLERACQGDLDRVIGCVRMLVLVQAAPHFHDVHRVADGASELFARVFEPLPPPPRSSFGAASLPMNMVTEVEASFVIS
jgi:enamine deaminase RidA (YjgF/YER057c/UK114 family)